MSATLSHKTRSRGRRTGGSYRPIAEINVTPMVDVMLVLLIIFMVAAPMLTAGVDVNLPASKAKALQTEDQKPIEITVDKDGKIYLADTEIKKMALISILKPMMEGDEERRIYVRGDRDIEYGKIMEVLGHLNNAGFRKVALISRPKN
ncbi:MAG: protein TolR [Alphaproteobacteria bacterium]|nr:MAG: protein TolR [Alphaproteobacteria bacterium]